MAQRFVLRNLTALITLFVLGVSLIILNTELKELKWINMTSKKRIDLHLTVSMFEDLKRIAEDKDITITTLLKLIIQEYLNNKRGK